MFLMKFIKRGFLNIMKFTKEKIKYIKTNNIIREYFKNNVLFTVFVITAVINSTLLRFLCMHTIENYLSFKAILADTVIASFIGAFGYLVKPKNRFTYYMSFTVFLTAICMINSVYYTFYTSFASISMLSLTQYIGDVGDAVVENVVQIKDIVYVIAPIAMVITYLRLKKKNYFKKVELKADRRKRMIKSLSGSGILFVLFLFTLTSLDISRFFKQWNK